MSRWWLYVAVCAAISVINVTVMVEHRKLSARNYSAGREAGYAAAVDSVRLAEKHEIGTRCIPYRTLDSPDTLWMPWRPR